MKKFNAYPPKGQQSDLNSLLDLFSIKQSNSKKCHKKAPHICVPPTPERHGYLSQACCNDWNCPRCGKMRARFEYGRMVVGARELAKDHQLYMMTITLPGTISLEQAEGEYYERTNRLHASINYIAKKHGGSFHYAAVTERQRRGHPHTHYLTTFCPFDAYYIVDDYERYTRDVQRINALIPEQMRYSPEKFENIDHRQMFSFWLSQACVKAGLGVQCRMCIADLVEGASRYIAKYLFEATTTEQWPKKWRRIRYSRSWPKMPEFPSGTAFVVISRQDWDTMARLGGTIDTRDQDVFARAMLHLCLNVKFVDREAQGGTPTVRPTTPT